MQTDDEILPTEMHRGIIPKQVRVVNSNFGDHLITLTTELLDPGGSEVEEDTVVVKKMLLFPLPSIPFVPWQNGAQTDCNHKQAVYSILAVSFPAVVYWAREQALYCGIGITISTLKLKFIGWAT